MDKTDYRILRILKENGRESASDIGKEIHLSVSAVLDRIKKLEDSGVIKSYTILVDSSKLGNDVIALMEVSLEHPRFYDEFTETVRGIDAVVDCYYLTGDFDFNLKVICASSDELEQIHLFEEGTDTKVKYGEKEVTLNRLKLAKRDGVGTKQRK